MRCFINPFIMLIFQIIIKTRLKDVRFDSGNNWWVYQISRSFKNQIKFLTFAFILAFALVYNVEVTCTHFIHFYADGWLFGTSTLEITEFCAAYAICFGWRSHFFGNIKCKLRKYFLRLKLMKSEETMGIMKFGFDVNDTPFFIGAVLLIWSIISYNICWNNSVVKSWITMIDR